MCEYLAASRQNLTNIGNAILDSAVSRRAQRVIGYVNFVQLNIMSSRIKDTLGYSHSQVRRIQSRCRRIDLLSTLIEQLLSRVSALD